MPVWPALCDLGGAGSEHPPSKVPFKVLKESSGQGGGAGGLGA